MLYDLIDALIVDGHQVAVAAVLSYAPAAAVVLDPRAALAHALDNVVMEQPRDDVVGAERSGAVCTLRKPGDALSTR